MARGIPVFDGHNDVLLRLWLKKSPTAVQDFLQGDGLGHIDFPRAKAGQFGGGMFAIFVPNPDEDHHAVDEVNPPIATQVPFNYSLPQVLEMAALLLRIDEQSQNAFKICRSVADISWCLENNVMAAVMHVEGAEGIDPGFHSLDILYAAGLRSLGPVWSRPNQFGHGVPFRFPSSPDTGPGLTGLGKDLIRYCNERRIAIDLSHLNMKGFWDVAELSQAPLIATHSNAHAICESSRNLTDDQLRAIAQSRGMVGLNFANAFLRPDGRWGNDTPFEIMLRHLDHLLSVLGEDGVGLGSDYEGARIPAAVRDVAGLPALQKAMLDHGYGEALVRKISAENWLRVLKLTWDA
jgi:membrane dipeptidase